MSTEIVDYYKDTLKERFEVNATIKALENEICEIARDFLNEKYQNATKNKYKMRYEFFTSEAQIVNGESLIPRLKVAVIYTAISELDKKNRDRLSLEKRIYKKEGVGFTKQLTPRLWFRIYYGLDIEEIAEGDSNVFIRFKKPRIARSKPLSKSKTKQSEIVTDDNSKVQPTGDFTKHTYDVDLKGSRNALLKLSERTTDPEIKKGASKLLKYLEGEVRYFCENTALKKDDFYNRLPLFVVPSDVPVFPSCLAYTLALHETSSIPRFLDYQLKNYKGKPKDGFVKLMEDVVLALVRQRSLSETERRVEKIMSWIKEIHAK